MKRMKICAETTCNFVYEADSTGLCPKCGSEGIWLSGTVLGNSVDWWKQAIIEEIHKRLGKGESE